MNKYHIFYRYKRCHSRYMETIEATSIENAWEVASSEHLKGLSPKGLIEFYLQDKDSSEYSTIGLKIWHNEGHIAKPLQLQAKNENTEDVG